MATVLQKYWESGTKRLIRKFRLTVDVPRHQALVEEVLSSLENDRLRVFRPDDPHALDWQYDNQGSLVMSKLATLPISIREWLCVGCQLIATTNGLARVSVGANTLAVYRNNACQCLFPLGPHTPAGPAAFWGEILLTPQCLPRRSTPRAVDAFKFVVAHELSHAFDVLRILVPAVMDWEAFWKIPLGEGGNRDKAASLCDDKSLMDDGCATRQELSAVKQYWPSQARKWFNAFNTERNARA